MRSYPRISKIEGGQPYLGQVMKKRYLDSGSERERERVCVCECVCDSNVSIQIIDTIRCSSFQ